MSKSTIVLLVLAALGLGSLIGASLADSDEPIVPEAEMSAVPEASAATSNGAPRFRYIAPGDIAAKVDEFGRPEPSTSGENFVSRDRAWRSETITIELPLDGGTEYKAIMTQGDSLVFNWTTNSGEVYYDFHAHDEAFGDEFFTRYDEGEGNSRSGAILAPYDGEHGWYWLNIADGPTTITLEVAGFYKEIVEIDLEGS